MELFTATTSKRLNVVFYFSLYVYQSKCVCVCVCVAFTSSREQSLLDRSRVSRQFGWLRKLCRFCAENTNTLDIEKNKLNTSVCLHIGYDRRREGGSHRQVVASQRVSRQVEVCEGGGDSRVGTESLTEAVHTCKKRQTYTHVKIIQNRNKVYIFVLLRVHL